MERYEQAWLNYRKSDFPEDGTYFSEIHIPEESPCIRSAAEELAAASEIMYGVKPACVCGTAGEGKGLDGKKGGICLRYDSSLAKEGYRIDSAEGIINISGADAGGILYGVFALLRELRAGKRPCGLSLRKEPANALRMLNHWDNMDGSIERGYSGKSFFFRNNEVLVDERTKQYARLAASVGINAVVINNVNVKDSATWLITDRYFDRLQEMSRIFSAWNIRLFLSVNFAGPIEVGGLSTCDPLEPAVEKFWQEQCARIYAALPEFGGFLVKADSEGRPGPFTYGRNHAEGANLLARALKPYGGTVIWRCFVYNCTQDWRDRKTDRARSAYDTYMPLDGQFDENVILQIKNGPMDFQVREPVSPLLGGLTKTRQMLEGQIAQEYTGQQIHVCYLIPMFLEVLNFHTGITLSGDREPEGSIPETGRGKPEGADSYGNTRASEEADGYGNTVNPGQADGLGAADIPVNDCVKDIIAGKAVPCCAGGFAAVANTGDDANWTGHDLAAANFYGFGRLALDTELTAEEIAKEWIRLTFGTDPETEAVLMKILMMSWPAYEHYNAPLGIGWMVNPNHHYGPNVDGYEYDRWGTYHRSDCKGLGVDRTDAGTGFAGCYHAANHALYNDPRTCPDELCLFFHHLPYVWKLKSGKTVIQHIYDTHFQGAEEAAEMERLFAGLKGKLPDAVYERCTARFHLQTESAREWRDRINTYYFRMSGIPDAQGREIF